MLEINETPTYNLKVVVNETGVKPDTLRAWERRYGLPDPERTEGGHRLYSQKDIEIIKWLLARQEEGMSISRAVKLWQSLLQRGPASQHIAVLADKKPDRGLSLYATGSELNDLRTAWIQACMDFDEPRAEQVLTQSFALYPPEVVCVEVLQKGISQIGDMWYQDKISVQQEHFASALAMRRLNTLLAAAPAPTRPGRILVGTPPHENHTFPALLLTLLLRYRGWDLLYLGANVPQLRFANTIEAVHPHLIVLTAQTLHTAATLAEVAYAIEENSVLFAFGGSIFNRIPDLQYHIPGHFLGTDFGMAIETAEMLLTRPTKTPAVAPVPQLYQRAVGYYRQAQAMIEAKVWQELQEQGMAYEHFVNANIHLSRDIVASLMFGDMNIAGAEIAWVEKLLLNYNMPLQLLRTYLQAYYDVVRTELDEELGKPIVDWLAQLTQR